MGLIHPHHGYPQDGEWDKDFSHDEPGNPMMIADSKWIKLAMLPMQFVMVVVLIILGTLMCSLVLSPIFVAWKFGSFFANECGKVWKEFAGK